MNEVHQQLHTATFRGVPFLIRSSVRQGGRKTVAHEYPNTDRRFIEDLGKAVPTFQIIALINGKEDYFQKRDRFIAALEEPGSGQLSHPFYGIQNVSVLQYSLNEDLSRLGRAEFSIDFAITSEDLYPKQATSGSATVSTKAQSLINSIQTYVEDNFSPATNNRYEHRYMVNILSDVVTSLGLAISRVQEQLTVDEGDLSEARNHVIYLDDNKDSIARSSSLVGEALVEGMEYINNLDIDATYIYQAFYTTFQFRDDSELPAATTIQKVKNLEHHYLITGVYNMLALAYAYQNAADMDYFTSDDVELVRQQLEDQYRYILTINDVDYELLNTLRDLRTEMREYFNLVGKQVYRVDSVRSSSIPLSVLAYQYYGSLDLVEELRQLNTVIEPSFVEGEVRILAQ